MTHAPRRHPRIDGPSGVAAVLLVFSTVLGWGVAGMGSATAQTTDADGPSLIERYRAARLQLLVRRRLRRTGGIPVLPPEQLPTPADSLRPPEPTPRVSADQQPSFSLHDVRSVQRLERGWFRERFADAEWSFLGATPDHTFFDTTRTRALRARLQAQFGDPTQTLGDAPFDGSRDDRPQFEYWFVVNDSIPVRVTDPRGPRGRGLILSAERPYRDRLRILRDTLLAPLRRSERAPYVDYYYDDRLERWYRTGFDGRAFFLERISRADVVPGRRAQLDTINASPDAASPADGNSP